MQHTPFSSSFISNNLQKKLIRAFYLYLIILFIEGAMRKWFLPGASDLFLIARDPIAFYVLILGWQIKRAKSFYFYFFFIFAVVNFILAITIGHQHLLVAVWGFRVYGIHIPAIFIFASALTKEHIYHITRLISISIMVMGPLVVLQYFSPKTAWVNIGVGGEGSSTFGGVADYFRPSGTFSFTTALAYYILLATASLFTYALSPLRHKKERWRNLIVIGAAFTQILLVVFSLSRTVILQTVIIVAFVLFTYSTNKRNLKKIIQFFIISITIGYVAYSNSSAVQLGVDNTLLRFDSAAESEGDFVKGSIGSRYLGSFERAFINTQNFSDKEIPLFGFGMGSPGRVGTALLGWKVNSPTGIAEEEWSYIICEFGLVMGGILLLIGRTLFPIKNALQVIRHKKQASCALIAFTPPFLITMIYGQINQSSVIGFLVIITSIFLRSKQDLPH